MADIHRAKIIRMDPAVSEQLQRSIESWARPFLTESTVVADVFKGDEAMLGEALRTDLTRIFHDNQLLPVEAPKLWSAVKKVAETRGDPNVLDAQEAKQVTLALTLQPVNVLRPNQPLEADPRDRKELIEKFISESPLLRPIHSIGQIFASDKDELQAIVVHLEDTLKWISNDVAWLSKHAKTLTEEEQSYLNFISAENLWGLSSRIAYDGKTFSSARRDEAARASVALEEILLAAKTFVEGFVQNDLLLDHPSTRAFVDSPYFEFAHLIPHLNGEAGDNSMPAARRRLRSTVIGMSRFLESLGAEDMATAYYSSYSEHYGLNLETERVFRTESLQSGAWHAYYSHVVPWGNALASLPTVASYLTGSFAGRILANMPRASAFMQKMGERLGEWKLLLPGAAFGNVAITQSTHWAARVANFGAASALELGKLGMFEWAGYYAADEDYAGAHMASALYMFAMGARLGFSSQHNNNLVREVLATDVEAFVSGRTSDLAAQVVQRAESMSLAEVQDLARRVSHFGRARSFRLERGIEPEALANRLMRFRSDLASASKVHAKALESERIIEKALDELGTLIAKNPKVVSFSKLEDAKAIVAAVDDKVALETRAVARLAAREKALRAAKRQVEGLLSHVKGEVNAAARAASRRAESSTTVASYPKGPRRTATPTPTSRWKVKTQDLRRLQPAAPREVSEIERVLRNPPETLSDDVVSLISHERVAIQAAGEHSVGRWYTEANAGHRQRLVELVNRLGESGFSRGWTRIRRMSDGSRRARIGDYRVFARPNASGNGYDVYAVKVRSQAY